MNESEKCLHSRTSVTEDSHLDKVGILQMFLQDRVIRHCELLKHRVNNIKNQFSNFITEKISLKLVAGCGTYTYPCVLVVPDDEG